MELAVMATLPGMGTPRVIAFCRSTSPVCPKCGRLYMDTSVPADGGVMLFCNRKRLRGEKKVVCGGRAYVTGLNEEQCVVIGISSQEWERLKNKRGHQIIRDLGLLVEAITELSTG